MPILDRDNLIKRYKVKAIDKQPRNNLKKPRSLADKQRGNSGYADKQDENRTEAEGRMGSRRKEVLNQLLAIGYGI